MNKVNIGITTARKVLTDIWRELCAPASVPFGLLLLNSSLAGFGLLSLTLVLIGVR
jgi:hypothetical protein